MMFLVFGHDNMMLCGYAMRAHYCTRSASLGSISSSGPMISIRQMSSRPVQVQPYGSSLSPLVAFCSPVALIGIQPVDFPT
mmetsp:Transcript_3550/g.4827  ORF Transcript_3550/g.4827 Transcript_3550/m.4827 type:complete len:81 (+) Transcript_3550:136-378(+)